VPAKTAELVSAATISALKPIPNAVFTITADNGTEFAYHVFILLTHIRRGKEV
jgi:IS30 family transposase